MNGDRRKGRPRVTLPDWASLAPANLSLAVLSVGLALVVWVAVTNSEDTSEIIAFRVPVQAVNVPAGYQAGGISPKEVSVTASGPSRALRSFDAKDIKVEVDLSNAGPDDPSQSEVSVTRSVDPKKSGGDSRVQVGPVTEQVTVTLQRRERREVRVDIRRVGVLPVGYDIESITVDPPRAVVEGTGPNVKPVESVSADVKLDGLTVTTPLSVQLEARDAAGFTRGNVDVQPASATVRVVVKPLLYRKDVLVDVKWRGAPKAGFRAFSGRAEPALVTVLGPLEQVNTLTAVPTEQIDIDGADRDVVRSVRLQLPQGVLVQPSQKEPVSQFNIIATIPVQAERGSAPLGVVPRVVNVAPGLTAQLNTPIVALTFSGTLADLAQLRPTDVSVTVDVAGLGAGTHRVEPKVGFPPALQIAATVPDKVEVVLR